MIIILHIAQGIVGILMITAGINFRRRAKNLFEKITCCILIVVGIYNIISATVRFMQFIHPR